jgi:hypothetical protein
MVRTVVRIPPAPEERVQSSDRAECTCLYCRTDRIQNQSRPDGEEKKQIHPPPQTLQYS